MVHHTTPLLRGDLSWILSGIALNHPSNLRIALLIFTVGLVGCSKSVDSTGGSGPRSWTITGQTHTLGSVEPLPGVSITCSGVSTTSGADGAYELRNVPEGSVTITASKSDYDTYSSTIDVKSDVRHFIFMTFDGTDVSGSVSNAVNGPIKGARISLRGAVAITDAGGRYELTSVKHGADTLFVTHPSYTSAKTPVNVKGAVQQLDVVLLRDSVVQVKASVAKFVFEGQPDVPFFNPLDQMNLSTNGYDSNGQYQGLNRRHIYIYLEMPTLLYDSRVSVPEASIQIHAASAYFSTPFQTYAVNGSWTTSLTYSSQPPIGSLLFSGLIGDSLSVRYWTVLDTDGFKEMLKSLRTNGTSYGITVQGGRVAVTSFHSMYAAQFLPILTIRMRY